MAAVARIPFYTRGISHSPAARSSVPPPIYRKLQVQRKFDTVSRSQTTGGIHQVSALRPINVLVWIQELSLFWLGFRVGLTLAWVLNGRGYVSMNLLCHWGMVAMVASELGPGAWSERGFVISWYCNVLLQLVFHIGPIIESVWMLWRNCFLSCIYVYVWLGTH